MEEIDWDEIIVGLKNGDSQACAIFWEHFGTRLQTIAQKQLSSRLQRRVGSDDVVQSACRTFFRRVNEGQFDLPDVDALWRLMCAITLTKARRAARDHSRKKRGISSEQYLDAETDQGTRPQEISDNDSSPVDAAMFADQLDLLLANLSPLECQVLDLKLQNHTNEEVAEQVGCSERTVRRITKQISAKWTQLFSESAD